MTINEEKVTRIIELQRQMNRIIRDRTLDSWVNLSLTIPQLKSLFYVSRHGKVKLHVLASGLKVTPGNVTGIVERLVGQGLLKRSPDPVDRRVLWLELTARGDNLLTSLREGRVSEMHRILENLTPEQLSTVERSFELLLRAAESVREKDTPHNSQTN